ncbi:MAG: sn-glycerol-3-phosphate ABC transporter ATP-binding protein UgpC [Muricomes sp.]
MPQIQLKHIYKKFEGGVTAVKDFHMDISDKEFVIFVGPSGCGKSTTLRMIAGLEEISEGELIIDGKRMNEVQPCERDMSMVFQNYALYPHMSVYDNIAYSLKLKKLPKQEIKEKVEAVAKTLELEALLDRKPKELSGGQKQRVAMGRAIIRKPKVFLMDEPLSNLDAKLRTQMRAEILKLYRELNTTFIYVTHDQTEAMTLGTRIVVLKDGEIQQIASPEELYNRPENIFVAGFIGTPSMNFLNTKCVPVEGKLYLKTGENRIPLPEKLAEILRKKDYIGEKITLGIRPEDMIISCETGIKSTVRVYEMLGAEAYLYFEYEGTTIAAKTAADTPIRRGDEVYLGFDMEKAHLFDGIRGNRI